MQMSLGSMGLFHAGNIDLLKSKTIAIIGSRDANQGSLTLARRLATICARNRFCVVSGLAAGVDAEALRAAISAGGSVIGVIGTPLDVHYPKSNKSLQTEISANHLLITRHAPGQAVTPADFIKRNKIVVEISSVVLAIACAPRSGTESTIREAVKQGRIVVVPQSFSLSCKSEFVNEQIAKNRIQVISRESDLF